MSTLRIHRRAFQLWARLFSSSAKRFKLAERKRAKRAEVIRYTRIIARSDFMWFVEFPMRLAAINAELSVARANAELKAAKRNAHDAWLDAGWFKEGA